MPEAEAFEAPQGSTFFGRYLESITEAFVGNGITNDGDAEVTEDANVDMGVQVAAASELSYNNQTYNVPSDTFQLSEGPSTTTNGEPDRRVDMVAFDSTLNSGSGGYTVVEGAADPNPEAPATPADGLLLALIAVPNAATNVDDSRIHNWRAHPAASTILSEGFESTASTTDFGPLFNIPVEGTTSQGTSISYTFDIDAETFIELDTDSDGSGGIENSIINFEKIVSTNAGMNVNGESRFYQTATFNDDVIINSDVTSTGSIIQTGTSLVTLPDGGGPFPPVINVNADNSQTNAQFGYVFGVDSNPVMSFTGSTDGNGDFDGAEISIQESIMVPNSGNFDALSTMNPTASDGDTAGYTLGVDGTGLLGISGEYQGGSVSGADSLLSFLAPLQVNYMADIFNDFVFHSGSIVPDGPIIISYPTNAAPAAFVEMPIDDTESAGDSHDLTYSLGGEDAFRFYFENDGSGSPQNTRFEVVQPDGSFLPIVDSGVLNREALNPPTTRVSGHISQSLSDATQRAVVVDSLVDTEGIQISEAVLTGDMAQAAPTDVNLELVTFDGSGGYTTQSTILSGDGSAVYDGETTGTQAPLAFYQNTSGSEQSVGVIVDNATGSEQYTIARAEGVTVVPPS